MDDSSDSSVLLSCCFAVFCKDISLEDLDSRDSHILHLHLSVFQDSNFDFGASAKV